MIHTVNFQFLNCSRSRDKNFNSSFHCGAFEMKEKKKQQYEEEETQKLKKVTISVTIGMNAIR